VQGPRRRTWLRHQEAQGREVIDDALLGTGPNTFTFVGIKSSKPIRSLFLDTTGGASENEGVAALWAAP
jgi:hypothetical protein